MLQLAKCNIIKVKEQNSIKYRKLFPIGNFCNIGLSKFQLFSFPFQQINKKTITSHLNYNYRFPKPCALVLLPSIPFCDRTLSQLETGGDQVTLFLPQSF